MKSKLSSGGGRPPIKETPQENMILALHTTKVSGDCLKMIRKQQNGGRKQLNKDTPLPNLILAVFIVKG